MWINFLGRRKKDCRQDEVHQDETQETITQWAKDAFGSIHPRIIAERMATDVNELLDVFAQIGHKWDGGKLVNTPVADIDPERLQKLHMKCADIEILLRQVAEALQVDLPTCVNFKMFVNRKRRWACDEQQQHIRHITSFKEKRSGIEMRLDCWYCISNTGKAFVPDGFAERKQALNWARSRYVCSAFGHSPEDVGFPPWDPEVFGWKNYGESGLCYAVNVVYGRDLYDYWQCVQAAEEK